MAGFDDLDLLATNVIRGISMDAPQKANAGHPGTAMALSPLAHVLFTRHIKFDPSDLNWFDRDRFILSCGHACILLYSVLHLLGAGLTLEDLKNFRQLGSRTPGHPESHIVPGVEVTTGPLGQGVANAVGMAIAEAFLRAKFGEELVNHRTWVICSDGDLMEGISHESASLAGHLGLDHLCVIYDDNHITIDGPTSLTYSEVVSQRFLAYNWNVINLGDSANDFEKIDAALVQATNFKGKPTLIILRSHIGYPSPNKTDTSEAHGEPLGEDEVKRTKEILGLPTDKTFYIPEVIYKLYQKRSEEVRELRQQWEMKLASVAPEKKEEFLNFINKKLPDNWDENLPEFEEGTLIATRKALQEVLQPATEKIGFILSGSADLTGNTGVKLKDSTRFSKDNPLARQLAFGIREHAMGASMVGMARHGGILPIGGTFFVFSDYMRPSIRLSALSCAHLIYSFTHDSIGLGEDGPTHQPIEHLASLRAMPELTVIRPADANEVLQAFKWALKANGPVALILTRQNVKVLKETKNAPIEKGAYLLYASNLKAQITLVATGSEVSLAYESARELEEQGIGSRVVSFPSFELFEKQSPAYKEEVIPRNLPSLSIEAASTFGWERYVTNAFGIDKFGASGKGEEVMKAYGFYPANIIRVVKDILNKGGF